VFHSIINTVLGHLGTCGFNLPSRITGSFLLCVSVEVDQVTKPGFYYPEIVKIVEVLMNNAKKEEWRIPAGGGKGVTYAGDVGSFGRFSP